ncbi:hypothetical protein [Chromatium okenii]|uniref:hypothetical protein n=1 Tax=Chromatium okenii TaxID=61644 RepID=UPI0011B0864D|nr:hypothetical protein [Chromatium okenii]
MIALIIGIAIGWVGRGFMPCPVTTSPVSIPAPETAAYLNARFQFSVRYPAQLLYPQGEADNGDGQRFVSRDARTTLAAFGTNLLLNGSLDAEFEEVARDGIGDHPLRVVTYKKLGNNWYVVSGVEQGLVSISSGYRLTINSSASTSLILKRNAKRGIKSPVRSMLASHQPADIASNHCTSSKNSSIALNISRS